MKQKLFFEKRIQNGQLKKTPPTAEQFPAKFHGLVLGLVGLVKKNLCLIPMKISHKLCVRIDGTQFLLL